MSKAVILGIDSGACVFKTALDVFGAGYRPVVLADLCHSSNGVDRHGVGVEFLNSLVGAAQVMMSDMMPRWA